MKRVDNLDSFSNSAIDDEWWSRLIGASKSAFSDWKQELLAHAYETKGHDASRMSLLSLTAISRMESGDYETLRTICGLRPIIDGELFNPMILATDDTVLGIVNLSSMKIGKMLDLGLLRQMHQPVRKEAALQDYDGYIPNPENCQKRILTQDYNLLITMMFGEHLVEVETIQYSVQNTLTDNFDSYSFLDYGAFDLTVSGKELAEILEPSSPKTIGEYIRTAYKKIEAADRAAKRPISEYDFGRAIDKTLGEQMKRVRRLHGLY